MSFSAQRSFHTAATVVEVLPVTGLAYLDGDDHRCWAITKSTAGTGLDALQPGKRVELTIVHACRYDVVSAYCALD
jgi:hypothetical protein